MDCKLSSTRVYMCVRACLCLKKKLTKYTPSRLYRQCMFKQENRGRVDKTRKLCVVLKRNLYSNVIKQAHTLPLSVSLYLSISLFLRFSISPLIYHSAYLFGYHTVNIHFIGLPWLFLSCFLFPVSLSLFTRIRCVKN